MVGIELRTLRALVLEFLTEKPQTQFREITRRTAELAASRGDEVFPSKEYCEEHDLDYAPYGRGELNAVDQLNINQIIWDLIIERILTIGKDTTNDEWPWLRLTDFGQSVVSQFEPSYYDPEGYVAALEELSPEIDEVIRQYALEGMRAFKQRLYFAAAVMFGAVAERVILLLLETVGDAETDQKRKREIIDLLDRGRLPAILEAIQSILNRLIKNKTIPYSIHEGSTHHLLALFEMIRVHRNDAVHPTTGEASRTKVFLAIQTLPSAIEIMYRLIDWFSSNRI